MEKALSSGFIRNGTFDSLIFDREILYAGLDEANFLLKFSYFNRDTPLAVIGHTLIKGRRALFIPEINCLDIDTGAFVQEGCLTIVDVDSRQGFNDLGEMYDLIF